MKQRSQPPTPDRRHRQRTQSTRQLSQLNGEEFLREGGRSILVGVVSFRRFFWRSLVVGGAGW